MTDHRHPLHHLATCLGVLLLATACANPHLPTSPAQQARTSTMQPSNLGTQAVPAAPVSSSPPLAAHHPTLTPEATVPLREINDLVAALLTGNGGCFLPCWWGIVPGSTRSDQAYQFLSTIGATPVSLDNGNYSFAYRVPGEAVEAESGYHVDSGIVDLINVDDVGTSLRYRLPQLLADYGKPDEVLIWTSVNLPVGEGPYPFYLLIHYPRLGVLASYHYDVTRVDEGHIVSCPQHVGPTMWLWSPTTPFTLEGIKPLGPDLPFPPQQLEMATGISLDSFYNTFAEHIDSQCLETPLSNWP